MLGLPSTEPSVKEKNEALDWIGDLRRNPSDLEGLGQWLESVEHSELDSNRLLIYKD